jgi:hypothetical protein
MTEDKFVWPVRDPKLGAWFGSPELKAWALAKMVAHRAQDEIIRGHYQRGDSDTAAGYRGCLVGCTLPRCHEDGTVGYRGYLLPGAGAVPSEGSWHVDVEILYGIPWEVANLLDDTFEDQAFEKAADFAVASIEAIPVGMLYDPAVLEDLVACYLDGAEGVLRFLRTGVAA